MHELGITRNVVAICSEHANGAPVRRVRLQIGQLSAVLPEAVRFLPLRLWQREPRGRCR